MEMRTTSALRDVRRQRPNSCSDHLIVAPLSLRYGGNLGTLLRTCDAVGACPAVPRKPWIRDALAKDNTLRQPSCGQWVNEPLAWLAAQRIAGSGVVGVDLTDESIRLVELRPARRHTVVVLGHESDGIPPEATEVLDTAVEIPYWRQRGGLSTWPWPAHSTSSSSLGHV
jgi:tRNA (guanosine-2'-O-)-methyltransferase